MRFCLIPLAALTCCLGCNLLPATDSNITGTSQVQLEVRFVTVTDTFVEEIGLDFNTPLAMGEDAFGGPVLGSPLNPQMPLAFPGNVVGGQPGSFYLYPTDTTGGFLPGTFGFAGDDTGQVLAWPAVRSAFAEVVDRAEMLDDIGLPMDLDDLVLGTNAASVAEVFGRTLTSSDADDLLDRIDDANGTAVNAPPVVVTEGQRILLQMANELSLPALSDFDFLEVIRTIEPQVGRSLIGPVLDVVPDVQGERVVLHLTWGTQVVSIGRNDLQVIDNEARQVFVPITRLGTVRTAVQVQDGNTVMLAGFANRNGAGQAGLPLLSDLPVVNRAFRDQAVLPDDQPLLIFITPRIVSGTE